MKGQKTNVKSIIMHLERLYEKARELNPATKEKGTNLSWDDYNKTIQEIKDFKGREVTLR